MPTIDPVIIDWAKAEQQALGDLHFLAEVLGDMLSECDQAIAAIQQGITTRQFSQCMKAAHQVKGSAAYLATDKLLQIVTSKKRTNRNYKH